MQKENKIFLKLVEADFSGNEKEKFKINLEPDSAGKVKTVLNLAESGIKNCDKVFAELDGERFLLNRKKPGAWRGNVGLNLVDTFGSNVDSPKLGGEIFFNGFPHSKDFKGKIKFELVLNLYIKEL